MTITLNESFVYFNLYLSTILWFVISGIALWDSLRMHLETREIYSYVKDYGNGRKILAQGRLLVSRWFLIGFSISFVIGIMAIGALFLVPLPRLDTSLYTFVLRYLIICVIFCFWRAKRTNIGISRRLEQLDSSEQTAKDYGSQKKG